MAKRRTLDLVMLAVLAGVVCAVYCRALDAPFIFDDLFSITENPSITRLWPLIGDSQHPGPLNPTKDLPTAGRPLVNLSLAVNYHFGQLNPVGYHVFNVVVHLLSAILVMAIVRRTLQLDYFEGRFDDVNGPLAFLAALLWAVHPLQTEAVVYVTQRTELMVGFFYLATLYASLWYWEAKAAAGRKLWLGLATLACLAGAACKEVMVTAPVIVLLFERTFIRGSFRQAWRESWRLYAGLLLSWMLLLYLNYTRTAFRFGKFSSGTACVCLVVHTNEGAGAVFEACGLAMATGDSLRDTISHDADSSLAVAAADRACGDCDAGFASAAQCFWICWGMRIHHFVAHVGGAHSH